MTNKEIYASLCEQYDDIVLFQQQWWMSAVCAGKQWDVLFSRDDKGEIRAAMPYLYGKKFWMKYVLMPQETQINGIWLRPDIADSIETVKAVCDDFLQQLKDMHLAYFYQHFPIGSPMPMLMHHKGYRLHEKVSYRIEDLTDLDTVVEGFSKNKKRQLQKALSLHVDLDMNEEDFYRFHQLCLQQQKKIISYTREFFLVLYRKSKARNQSQIICIRDADDNPLAAAFVVWDDKQMYYLIPCYLPSRKDSGAGALLALESIKLARKVTKAFDFEGSTVHSIANHYRQFGSTAAKYYAVSKCKSPVFAILLLANRIRNRKKH